MLENFPNFVTRQVSRLVLDALADTPVVVVNGARQAGKSTLIAELKIPSIEIVTMDNATQRAAAKRDPTTFVDRPNKVLAIDEVQRVPELLIAIKETVDRDRRPGRFLLTGSTRLMSTPKLSETLAGRVEIIDLWPFSMAETVGQTSNFIDALFNDSVQSLRPTLLTRNEYLEIVALGGFPEARQRSGIRRSRWFANYVTTVVERLADDVASIERLHELPRLLQLCAARTANEINIASLANDIAIPARTLATYLAHLQTVFLVQLLPAWSTNLSGKVIRKPKLILTDTGLASYLLGYDGIGLQEIEAPVGQLLENFVAMEIKKFQPLASTEAELFHYRDRDGREVDLVLETRRGRVAGVEVKASRTVTVSDFRGLNAVALKLGKQFATGVVLYTGQETVQFGPSMFAMPISSLWG